MTKPVLWTHRATVALIGIFVLVATADGFAQSWAGLYGWATEHGLHGWKAMAFPGLIDLFILVGELGLFALALEAHKLNSRLAWFDLAVPAVAAVAGWSVSLAFNIGHVAHVWTTQATAAAAPVASMLGLLVLLRTLHRFVTRTAAPVAATRQAPRHMICAGPKGVVFLRRPKPSRAAYTELGGPEGSRIWNVGSLLSGLHTPVVYFVRNGNRIKIGTTQNLRPRISTLCLSVSDIEFVLHGGADYERALHGKFADYRVTNNREWFHLKGDLASFVRAGGLDPDPQQDSADDTSTSSPAGSATPAQPSDVGLEAAVRTAFAADMPKSKIMTEFNLKRWRVDKILSQASTDAPANSPEPPAEPAADNAGPQLQGSQEAASPGPAFSSALEIIDTLRSIKGHSLNGAP